MSGDDLTGEVLRDRSDRYFLIAHALLAVAVLLAMIATAWVWRQGVDGVLEQVRQDPFTMLLAYPPLSIMLAASTLAFLGVSFYWKAIDYHSFELYTLHGGLDDDE